MRGRGGIKLTKQEGEYELLPSRKRKLTIEEKWGKTYATGMQKERKRKNLENLHKKNVHNIGRKGKEKGFLTR